MKKRGREGEPEAASSRCISGGWKFTSAKQQRWNSLRSEEKCEWCLRPIEHSFHHTFELVLGRGNSVDRYMLCGLCVAHALTGMDWRYNQAGSTWSMKQFFYNPGPLDKRCLADGISPHFNDGEVYSGKPRAKPECEKERIRELRARHKVLRGDVISVDERMCEDCGKYLVAVYLKVGSAESADGNDEVGKEYCYYCAAKVFIELDAGKKKMILRQDAFEPSLYEIRV